jgi:hypothetical protein
VGTPEVSDELPGRRIHPPALKEGEEDDHGYGHDDPHDGDGRHQLLEREPSLLFPSIGELRSERVHASLIVAKVIRF